ncbi:hypothetical protein OG417_24945 [Actinoallomurus sp. NBC_01490]|uniref:hypothetical protein n=1 Tax=Actinoallomurus sp. NBC_01490 TaxID=2903557 RepID=UPI002E3706F5|nr:hypothetical protein [Actinoallomurus sp. NBC_01490]
MLWADRNAWLADEQRMIAVVRVSQHAEDTPHFEAVEYLFQVWDLIEGVSIGFNQREAGCIKIDDLAELCIAIGLDAQEIEAEPLAFTDRHGVFIGPWPVALEVAARVARPTRRPSWPR